MKLYIKYMVGLPCRERVKEELERLRIPFGIIDIGVVELPDDLSLKQREKLKNNLLSYGLKLYSTNKGILFEKIKAAILEMISYSDGQPVMSFSIYLSSRLGYDYTYLANIFSEVSGISIQQYIILSKIERAKELVLTEDISISEIDYQLHYSSVAHLSGQFKKVTGLSPSGFKLIRQQEENLVKNKREKD
ncbi:helix-turn-helix domain-containing protein [Salinimicrobium flavum]|uniref:Helix-turn-helix domain-containing protein n=1 Tax=Salinimicrobium flavum TaxID=1737065 RepID=A0ABW5ISC6_9FLAO